MSALVIILVGPLNQDAALESFDNANSEKWS